MKNYVLKLCKMQGFLFLCLLPMPLLSMLNNSSKRFYSHAQNIVSGALNRKVLQYFSVIDSRFQVDNKDCISDLIVDTQDNILLKNILGLCGSYENELIVSMYDADDKGINCFIAARAIHNDYKKKYAQQHESLSQGIQNYHNLEIPVAFQDFNIDRSSDTLAHNKSLREVYEDTYKDYTGYIEYPACMDSYYNIAKTINAVELRRQRFALRIALKDYILKYVEKNKINKVYALNSVTFSDKRSDGRDMPIAYFDPNINELRFSSNFRTHFFNKQSKSIQALTLMHEIEHASQAPWLHAIPAERQADERSVEECNCSICLQVKAAMLKNVVMPPGYLTSDDFACHARQSTFRCKAHTDHDITELQDALQRGDKLKIKEIDDAMGTIFDRLPKVD